jgi:PhnB protein
VSDPLDVLRARSSAQNPPPRFVLELYQRLHREFVLPTPGIQRDGPAGAPVRRAVPCLIVPDINQALDFYQSAFGAGGVERHSLPDGTLVYAAFRLGDTPFGLAADEPPWNRSPAILGGSTVPIDLDVDDADMVVRLAVTAGARVVIPVADQSYGQRAGRLADPFGHLWIISSPLQPTS